ncbi:MAG TPA: APC family permease [Candidatus Acidoferrales bacterium]|nr:APC family permease [Candidatus Acidoferrales bacterium]
MATSGQPTLVRAIGRWSLAALTINCIIASGIFGLPSVISGLVGTASPFAWLFAAVATALVMACFAEVSSRFDQTGGVYLYARTTFGQDTGITIAWLGWLARLTAGAANANLVIEYLAKFWPRIQTAIPRILTLALLIGFLAIVNYVGVRRGSAQSNLFTVAKLLTLGLFILVGLFFLASHPLVISAPVGPPKRWLHPILLLMFAYGGYETALMPGGEAKDPRRDYPFALLTALLTCTFVYTMTQLIVISVLPQSVVTTRPMAAAAEVMVGPWGATLVSIGVLASCYGYLSANVLGFPRMLFAMAQHGDMPPTMARLHPRYRTPHLAIMLFAALLYLFSIAGSFQWNVFISAMSRLIYYGSVCVALPVLRRNPAVPPPRFRLPMGEFLAVLAVGTSLLLFPRLDRGGLLVLSVLAVGVILNSVWASRNRPTTAEKLEN